MNSFRRVLQIPDSCTLKLTWSSSKVPRLFSNWENIALAHQDKVDRVTRTRTTQTCVFDRWFGHWAQTQLDCRALRRFDFCKAFLYSRILVACKNSLWKKGQVRMKREFPSVSFLRQKMFCPNQIHISKREAFMPCSRFVHCPIRRQADGSSVPLVWFKASGLRERCAWFGAVVDASRQGLGWSIYQILE